MHSHVPGRRVVPVPFVYAAVTLRIRRLWWPAGVYDAAWLAGCSLVAAMLTDYLPTSLDTYLRLPKDYTQRNPDGRTAAEELELQLRLLRDNAKDAISSLYRGDALRLQQQSALLESKFGTSELDLDR